MPTHKIICGKSEIELKRFDDNTFDSCVTDPPYELNFMNRNWDRSGIAFKVELWAEVYRVMKPGAHILVFGGSRTYHRMACAVEDAGFEVRDMIEWIYGSGFQKSLDISKSLDKMKGKKRDVIGEGHWNMVKGDNVKQTHCLIRPGGKHFETAPSSEEAIQWNGFGTGLKPSHEPILLARKPISERNIASNVLKWGVGGINVDGCRVQMDEMTGRPQYESKGWKNTSGMTGSINNDWKKGRFPANLILECCCEEDELVEGKAKSGGGTQKGINDSVYGQTRGHDIKHFNYGDEKGNEECLVHTNPACVCRILDEQSGELVSGGGIKLKAGSKSHGWNNNKTTIYDAPYRKNSTGGASRFFYQAKASQKERWFYCTICKQAYQMKERDNHIHNAPEKTKYQYLEFHPTQKPEKLIAYLARLITPPNGTMLDPFLGSGTGLIAAEREGFNCIGIDSKQEYCWISHQRLKNEIEQVPTKLNKEQSTIQRIGF